MKLPLYQVDAFTSRVFAGNPAAVVISEEWLPDETMQSIASEKNLSPRSPARSCFSKTGTRLGTRLRSRRKAVA
jgi:PhzF family phenazine biosynthesis protein